MQYLPTISDIRQAAERITPYCHRTPVLTCRAMNDISGAELFFKCENFQKVGAFKFRGACNAVFSLSREDAEKGVATHSSGNHAAALALAARLRGISAFVVMPENSPEIKKIAVAGYGANITFCQPTLADREATLARVVEATGATVIHPYNDYCVIAGQATAALELCEEVSDLDIVIAPVGGGGLISGTALAVAAIAPRTAVIAAEPAQADDAYRSMQTGTIQPSLNPQTIADGLRTSLGDKTFPIIRQHVTEIMTVSEAMIVQAMRLMWERMKIIVEPSSAVPLGALLSQPSKISGKRIGVIISGGNVDLAKLPWQP